MALNLILGPPNSGRRGKILKGLVAAAERDPVLVVPTLDDVYSFERELCRAEGSLGVAALHFNALFRAIATAAGDPPGRELSRVQRLRAVEIAVGARHGSLGPLRRSAGRTGFARAFARLLEELEDAGVEPAAFEAGAGTLEGSAYLSDISTLYAAYVGVRERSGRTDRHQIAREAIRQLRREDALWRGRPMFLYGFDDLTPAQLELVEVLAERTEVTVALSFDPADRVLAERIGGLLEALRRCSDAGSEDLLMPDPENTEDPTLFHLARGFGAPAAAPIEPGEGLRLLRSAGVQGEAEAIALEVSRLLAARVDPARIAIALRDPARRGPEIAAALERNGVAAALETELPVADTAVGEALLALLEAEFGRRRASELLRFMRGPSAIPESRVDWFERALRRGRIADAETALERWLGEGNELPGDLARLREAAASSDAEAAAEVGRIAARMAARPLRGEGDGPIPHRGDGRELRAAGRISEALAELAQLGELAPAPEELVACIEGLEFRVWSGPIEGRVRIASPYQLRADRFEALLVGSLQDGEFPRRDRGADPFLSEAQRNSLGLERRHDPEAEERYLFGVCLALPSRRLVLSYRDSDENGAAESRSPLLEEVRGLLAPPPDGTLPDPVEERLTRARELAEVVHALAEAPSEDELARALAVYGPSVPAEELTARAGVEPAVSERLLARVAAARRNEAASRAPGPLREPSVLSTLAAVAAYGGTTLELFDVCSYRWFAGHELDPQSLEPTPDPLLQGGLMHAALERLYAEPPAPGRLPQPDSLPAWLARGRELVAEVAAERELGTAPAERAMTRRVERLLERFLAEEAERDGGGFEPWLLEAGFGAEPDSERPTLDLGGWGLHGAIDRVDRSPDGRAVVIDYKLSGAVTPREKFEEQAKLQLPLYLLAVAEHWGASPEGGLYHPLRATSVRRPRGVVSAASAADLSGYGLYERDVVEPEELEELLEDSRRRGAEIVSRIRAGDIRRDPGPRHPLRGHDVCPTFCTFAPICRRDRAPQLEEDEEAEER